MKFGIQVKLVGSFLVVILFFILCLGIVSLVVQDLNSSLEQMQVAQRKGGLTGQLQLHLDEILKPASNYLITGEIGERDNFDGLITKISEVIKEIQGYKGDREWGILTDSLNQDILKLSEILITVLFIDHPVGNPQAAKLMQEANLFSEDLIQKSEKFNEMTRQEMARMGEIARSESSRVQYAFLGTIGMAMLFLTILSIYLSRSLIRPIMKLHRGAQIVAGGNLNHRLPVKTKDEIGGLAGEFNRMVEALSIMKGSLDNKLEETRRLAITDALTGLYNHRFCMEKLSEEIRRSNRYHHSLSIITADIDYFKHYNDTHGHLRGNDLLHILGSILKAEVRGSDFVCRTGGEEFVIILPETEEAVATQTAERLRIAIAQHPFPYKETQPGGNLTVSLGVASYNEDRMNLQTFLKAADDAMYRAKRNGRNKVAVYT